MCGIQLSLGSKHGVYAKPKPNLNRRHTRFHVDVFAVTERVMLGDETVFQDGAWCPSKPGRLRVMERGRKCLC